MTDAKRWIENVRCINNNALSDVFSVEYIE